MTDPDLHIEFGDCTSCPEGEPEGECPKSLRPCGHHCNHSWDQDCCHWCGVEFGEDGMEVWPEPVPVEVLSSVRICLLCGTDAQQGLKGPATHELTPAPVDPEDKP